MNPQTPLPAVALMLPRDAARLLEYKPQNRQEAVLVVVRRCLSEWEAKGMIIDPVTLEVVLISLVREILAVINAALQAIEGADADPTYRSPS